MICSAILAQCVMCYRNAAAQGAARGRVFDVGIVILLIPPVAIAALILWLAGRAKAGDYQTNGTKIIDGPP